MSKKKTTASGVMGRRLSTENFHGLTQTLVQWRMDPAIRLMDQQRDAGRILQFVKGLRFSAQIAYLIRDIVSGQNVDVSWGHLINEEGSSCSPECDIIIHRPGYFQRWNGREAPIMDFKFIECSKALAVISCKSSKQTINNNDKAYCETLAQYNLTDVFLFAECCDPNRVDTLKQRAINAGYQGFYYLYAIASDGFTYEQDEQLYIDFAEAMKSVAS